MHDSRSDNNNVDENFKITIFKEESNDRSFCIKKGSIRIFLTQEQFSN